MAEGAPKAPVVAEAHEVDTFREPFHALEMSRNTLSSEPPAEGLADSVESVLNRC